ncbi:MAG: diacylglycerol kinase family protein [Pseudomonadota bacterium]
MRIAVLRNPASTRNKDARAPALPPDVRLIEATGIDALDATLCDACERGLDLLVIDGGDGTIREVVSRLPEASSGQPPLLAIIAHGNTNLIARKMGALPGYEELAGLRRDRLLVRSTPVLRLDVEGWQRPLRGFICGWGAYATGTRIAVEEIEARGGGQVLRAILATFRRALFGGEGLRRGVRAKLDAKGHPQQQGARFLGIATVLEGPLLAGLNPFWGGGQGALRWLDILAPARWLALAAPSVALGRPTNWMTRSGYRAGRSERIRLQLDTPVVLDGELVRLEPGSTVQLSADETLRFATVSQG